MGSVTSGSIITKRQGEPPESAQAAASHSSGGSLVISAGQPPQDPGKRPRILDKGQRLHQVQLQLLQLRIYRTWSRIRVKIRRISRRIKRSLQAATIR
jgi:hypothetical protein